MNFKSVFIVGKVEKTKLFINCIRNPTHSYQGMEHPWE